MGVPFRKRLYRRIVGGQNGIDLRRLQSRRAGRAMNELEGVEGDETHRRSAADGPHNSSDEKKKQTNSSLKPSISKSRG